MWSWRQADLPPSWIFFQQPCALDEKSAEPGSEDLFNGVTTSATTAGLPAWGQSLAPNGYLMIYVHVMASLLSASFIFRKTASSVFSSDDWLGICFLKHWSATSSKINTLFVLGIQKQTEVNGLICQFILLKHPQVIAIQNESKSWELVNFLVQGQRVNILRLAASRQLLPSLLSLPWEHRVISRPRVNWSVLSSVNKT